METNVFIIESLNTNITSTLLHRCIKRFKNHPYKDVQSYLFTIETKDNLIESLQEIKSLVNVSSYNILDIEVHGSPASKGIYLTTNKLVVWNNFTPLIYEINHQTDSNIVLFIYCYLGNIPNKFLNGTLCKSIIYSDKIISSGDIVKSNHISYDNIKKNNNQFGAIE